MRLFIYYLIMIIGNLAVNGQVSFYQSNLPIILINTNGQQIYDEPKIIADMSIINNGAGLENKISDQPNDYNGKVGIEFRGSSSQSFPKKPYGFETKDEKDEDNDVSLLGMPKESDWTLNATYNDKSLMRDGLTYILAGQIMDYAPRVRYNELVINGQYQGVYLLIEKIKRDKARVNISKIDEDDNTGDELTGGYIIKIDKETGSNSGVGWNSPYPPYQGAYQKTFFQIDYPTNKNVTSQQKTYIKNHITAVEKSIDSPNFKDPSFGYRKYIDTKSLIDFIIINELAKNPDAYRLSTYFYKERDSNGGKIKFGPVWDFNLGFGNVDYCTQGSPNGLVITDFNSVCPSDGWVIHFWWKKFLADEDLYHDLKVRWKSLRENQLSNERIHYVIDSLSGMLNQAQTRNFKQWSVLGQYIWPNYYVGKTYQEEISHLKDWTTKRLKFLDEVWKINNSSAFDTSEASLTIIPNPATEKVTIIPDKKIDIKADILFYGANGSLLKKLNQVSIGEQIEVDISTLPIGILIIKVIKQDKVLSSKLIKY